MALNLDQPVAAKLDPVFFGVVVVVERSMESLRQAWSSPRCGTRAVLAGQGLHGIGVTDRARGAVVVHDLFAAGVGRSGIVAARSERSECSRASQSRKNPRAHRGLQVART